VDSPAPTPAVIFDVDGVLVDSYAAHLQSWLALAGETDVRFTEADFAATFGRTSRDVIRRSWPAPAGGWTEAGVRRLDERKEAIFRELVERCFPAMDGAVELIDDLSRAGIRLAVGSSAPPENVELVLRRLGRAEAFDAVVTGADVTRGKPDPQVFQVAAARLGSEPASCIVIEDAPAGIQAAQAAGMTAVALLSTGRRAEDFTALTPRLIVSSLHELSAASLRAMVHS
jgi:beta-phosphoglucomutase